MQLIMKCSFIVGSMALISHIVSLLLVWLPGLCALWSLVI